MSISVDRGREIAHHTFFFPPRFPTLTVAMNFDPLPLPLLPLKHTQVKCALVVLSPSICTWLLGGALRSRRLT